MRGATDFLHHRANVARLNNGSFGAAPTPVLEAANAYRLEFLAQPDALYFDPENGLDKRLKNVQGKLAQYLSTSPTQTCLVENATVAVSTIFQRWERKSLESSSKSNPVLMFNFAYGAVVNAARHHLSRGGKNPLVFADIGFPNTNAEEVLDNLDKQLQAHRPRYALLDHITSQPAIVLDIKPIIELCRDRGVEEIAIDGAHAVGSLCLNENGGISELGCDFYFSNLHKWALAPTSVTLLWHSNMVDDTSHAIISWPYESGLDAESRWPGTRDFSPFMAVPCALEYMQKWRSEDGALDMIEYNKRSCWEMSEMLASAFDTALPVPKEMSASMVMVQTPERLNVTDVPGQPSVGIRSILRNKYNIECAIAGFPDGNGYIRLSHHIYNRKEEYEKLRDAVLELADE